MAIAQCHARSPQKGVGWGHARGHTRGSLRFLTLQVRSVRPVDSRVGSWSGVPCGVLGDSSGIVGNSRRFNLRTTAWSHGGSEIARDFRGKSRRFNLRTTAWSHGGSEIARDFRGKSRRTFTSPDPLAQDRCTGLLGAPVKHAGTYTGGEELGCSRWSFTRIMACRKLMHSSGCFREMCRVPPALKIASRAFLLRRVLVRE